VRGEGRYPKEKRTQRRIGKPKGKRIIKGKKASKTDGGVKKIFLLYLPHGGGKRNAA